MCYVKVKNSGVQAATPLAQPAAQPTTQKDFTLDAFLGSTTPTNWIADLSMDDGSATPEAWFQTAMSSPLEFDQTGAMPLDTDWMSWLEGMSTFPADTLPPPEKMPLPFINQSIPIEAVSPTMSTDSTCILIPSPAITEASEYKPSPISSASTKHNKKRAHSSSEDDESCLKRIKNTEAARKSRARKAAKVDGLEHRVDELELEKSALTVRIAVLENDASSFAQREMDLKRRVALLEAQLAESHRALLAQA
ncbi:hypothetical protein BDR26DRAFT_855236 [Obelidium mucronatum]|nr:hypothetical protein BDR26DRAFT_855236 [Obelidium mucronatum]